ncbi:MAG TPA: c-type cytochrome [Polyangiaceae bacterium]|nr:c-type cytochrome [Polyangiaceae bacterium]
MSFGDWLDERTGHRAALERWRGEPMQGGASFAYVWGGATALCLLVIAVSGVVLMTAYQPSATTAWSSVNYIQTKLSMGWLLRGLHHNGAHVLVVLMVIHLVRTAVHAAYRKPRELVWLLGLAMMVLVLAFVRTGYLLPWDQEGYWATYIPINILGTMPGGTGLKELALGGKELGHLSLTRFYTLHVVVLPLAMGLSFWAHAKLSRRHGLAPRLGAKSDERAPYFPNQVALTMLAGLLVLGVLFAITIKGHGVPLQAPADPAADYPARPEWYFRAPFQALKYVPSSVEWLVLVGAPLVVGGYFVALPFMDKKGEGLVGRLGYLAPLALTFVIVGALTLISFRSDAGDEAFAKARERADQRAARAAELAAEGVPPAGPLAMLALDPQTRGPELYEKHCAVCHRLDEWGPPEGEQTAPDLTGFGTEKWVLTVLDNPDAPDMFGKSPLEGLMPSYTRAPEDEEEAEAFESMPEEEQKAIAEWLVAESKGTAEENMKGEQIAKTKCTSCHRLDGETDDEEGVAPELRGWASLEWIRLQIESPGNGRTYPAGIMDPDFEGHMPGYEDDLSPDEIALLAEWVYERATGRPAKPAEE